MKTKRDRYLITCEHGGNVVPPLYRPLFANRNALLESHRGWDPGALALARDLARALKAPLLYARVSRLVIDLNRSIGHPRLYSDVTRTTPRETRMEILTRHYLPYRNRAEEHIALAVAQGSRVVHVSSHSFTPILHGKERKADVGLLYDPTRPQEVALSRLWQAALKTSAPALKVRRNYPYAGTSDGFTAYLRRRFAPKDYVGIELEINQKHVTREIKIWRDLRARIASSLLNVLESREIT
ncbi:MAG TPA: N-formylglutamate amidohydrolase [Thiobacillaceae bacterium]|nr:N-formylglutamate amidohydrolase [Thiobacillaceae bacterium]